LITNGHGNEQDKDSGILMYILFASNHTHKKNPKNEKRKKNPKTNGNSNTVQLEIGLTQSC
jgi:hypothetical protein